MSLNYKITDITSSVLTVEFDNNTWANVPIEKGMSRTDIESRIAQFVRLTEPFTDKNEVPFKIGDSGTILSQQEYQQQKENEEKLSYAKLRQLYYPSIGDQLDAIYWARKGDSKELERIDGIIEVVKEAFPKDMEPKTQNEAKSYLPNLPDGMTIESAIEFLEQ